MTVSAVSGYSGLRTSSQIDGKSSRSGRAVGWTWLDTSRVATSMIRPRRLSNEAGVLIQAATHRDQ